MAKNQPRKARAPGIYHLNCLKKCAKNWYSRGTNDFFLTGRFKQWGGIFHLLTYMGTDAYMHYATLFFTLFLDGDTSTT